MAKHRSPRESRHPQTDADHRPLRLPNTCLGSEPPGSPRGHLVRAERHRHPNPILQSSRRG
ncbi:hypothetical protein BDW66DRAFT_124882 [Aspergillus desertorum]